MGACPISCLMHGRLPGVLQYARGAYRMNCKVQRRLPSGLAGCTSACSANLQYARGAYRMNCMVQRRLPSGLAGCTSACSAGCKVHCFPEKVHAN
ncbi:hypothetical protein CRG98_042555 [Punica granatum]|uniref:Uncharacterized protein n=1 Tax=Punica granatum TaxID=22663 RepID=A0A2I0HZC3_PUNGR|nr:hypothetical protein CRG98_042555 [Punica granatum]